MAALCLTVDEGDVMLDYSRSSPVIFSKRTSVPCKVSPVLLTSSKSCVAASLYLQSCPSPGSWRRPGLPSGRSCLQCPCRPHWKGWRAPGSTSRGTCSAYWSSASTWHFTWSRRRGGADSELGRGRGGRRFLRRKSWRSYIQIARRGTKKPWCSYWTKYLTTVVLNTMGVKLQSSNHGMVPTMINAVDIMQWNEQNILYWSLLDKWLLMI